MPTVYACTLENGNVVFIAAYVNESEQKIEDLRKIAIDFGDTAVIIATHSDAGITWTFTSSRAFDRDYIPVELMQRYNFVEVLRR